MLLFSTILQIRDNMAKDDFIQLVINWNQKSPHDENIIPGIEWNGEHNIRYGNEKLWLAIEEYRNENIIAVRYEKTEDDGVVWDTDYVMNFNDMKLSIRLDRSYLESALTIDQSFSTPYFITSLIDAGYLRDDENLAVSMKPFIVDDDNLKLVADVINKKVSYYLPVVYVSKTYYGEDPVDVCRLAKRLKGVAHVLVQKGFWQNARLRKLCQDQNEYYGAIGIYYPSQAWSNKRFLYRAYEGFESFLLEKVVRSVVLYSNAQMMDTLYTWQGVSNALLRDKLRSQRAERMAAESAKKQVEYEADTLIESVDEDLRNLQNQVEELTHANEILTYENQGLRTKIAGTDAKPVLYLGNEDDFFPGEIKEMLVKALAAALSGMDAKTRQAHVLQDIIQSNGGYQGIAKEKAKRLKSMLKGYKNVSSEMKQMFSDMGFIVSEEGKHYKLTYYGDSRYWTTIAKTPSDNRSGINVAATIIKYML